MAVDVHACSVFLGVDGVFDIFISDETEASRFFSLLIVDEFAALETIRYGIYKGAFTSSFPYRSKVRRNSSSDVLRPRLKIPLRTMKIRI